METNMQTANDYPRYESLDIAEIKPSGRKLEREWVNKSHIRLYFPDRHGYLRLVLINDLENNVQMVLDESILAQEFGASYNVLMMQVDRYYTKEETLDHLNDYPSMLYPVQPAQSCQNNGVYSLPELPPVACADAWI